MTSNRGIGIQTHQKTVFKATDSFILFLNMKVTAIVSFILAAVAVASPAAEPQLMKRKYHMNGCHYVT